LPVVAALAVAALPLPALGRAGGFFASSFLATATYVLSVAVLVRLTSPRSGDGPGRRPW
jgi:hypothetical protein